jgi:precorrin-6B methylase 2
LSPSFEQDVKEHFAPSKGETVIDIGAFIGSYTLLSAMKVGEEGHVYAFEPTA